MSVIARSFAVVKRHRVRSAAITAAIVSAAVATIVFMWPSAPTETPVAYSNISRNFKTCFISSTQDDAQAGPVWKAIQVAIAHAPINAERLTPPTGTPDQLAPYFNSLIALRCQLIVTTGTDLADALVRTATDNPAVHFLQVGSPDNLPNVHAIALSDTGMVTTYVLRAAHGTF